jgi:hypothetical protein
MNREFKFRVWSPDNKEMYHVDDIYQLVFNVDCINFIPRYEDHHDLTYFTTHESPDETEKTMVVMQYTERKDKKGREIYEGDIDTKSRVVKFIDGAWHVVQSNGQTYDYLYNMANIEIIGNIYENPELINQ